MSRMKKVLLASAACAVLLSSAGAAADEALDRARSLAAEARYAEAREALAPLLKRDPAHLRARLLYGTLNARTGMVSEAIDVFNALVRDHPDTFEAYNNLAVLYAVQGRLDEARETLLAALEGHPSAIGYANLGDVYTDLARRAYLRARALESGDETQAERSGAVATTTALGVEAEASVLELREAGSASGEGFEAGAPAGECVRAEGFGDLDEVAGAVEWLRARGAEIVAVRLEEDRRVTSYRVYLPPLGSHEQAAAKVREIQGRGERDVAIIGEGAFANAVSFGVYRDEENMRRRVSALEALGYAVRTAPDVEVVDEYVIEAQAPGAFAAEWTEDFPDRPLRSVECGRHRGSK